MTRGWSLLLGVALGGVADHPLFVAQLLVEGERVFPVEWLDPRLAHLAALPRIVA